MTLDSDSVPPISLDYSLVVAEDRPSLARSIRGQCRIRNTKFHTQSLLHNSYGEL